MFNLRISAQLRTLWQFKNTFPGVHGSGGDLFLGWSFEVGKKIFKKTLKKMFKNEVHCFLTTQCFQLLNCIESHRIELNHFYQHASFLVSYRAHVSRYKSDRLCHERFTPLTYTVAITAQRFWDSGNKHSRQATPVWE